MMWNISVNSLPLEWHPANNFPVICLPLLGTLAMIGNMFLIYLISRNLTHRKPYELLILNAAMIDFSIGCVNGIFEPILISKFSESDMRRIVGFIDYYLIMLAACQPPLIMLNRYQTMDM